MSSETDSHITPVDHARKRLRVLFIITTIFSSIILVYAFLSLFFWLKSDVLLNGDEADQKLVRDMLNVFYGPAKVKTFIESGEVTAVTTALANYYLVIILSCFLAVAGALLMRMEKYYGIFIYITAEALYVFSSFIPTGEYYFASWTEMTFSGLIALLFIGLYNQALRRL